VGADDLSAETRSWTVIGRAKRLVMARRQCTSEEAMLLLTRAASSYEMSLQELAKCIVADLKLQWPSDIPMIKED
jgi:AmiR/NasT family two-component response regulator